MVGSGNNSSSNSWCSLNLNSLDLSRGGSNNMVSNWGSIGISSSWNNSRGSYSNNWSSMGNGINKTVLIDILRESFQRKGSIAAERTTKYFILTVGSINQQSPC